MKERPILLSGEMVRAILDDRKQQTRRAVKVEIGRAVGMCSFPAKGGGYWLYPNAINEILNECPYGVPGDRLWVRETFWSKPSQPRCFTAAAKGAGALDAKLSAMTHTMTAYRADWGDKKPEGCTNWRPSIFMPRWASRLTLEITEVRVQRLQEISEEDAKGEGCKACDAFLMTQVGDDGKERFLPAGHPLPNTCRGAFAVLWDSINAKRGFGWEKNPFVWAIRFARVTA